MKTATKSSWSKVAQDLYGRWFVQEYVQERKQQRRKQTSIKMAACLQWEAPISYPI